MDAAEEQSLPPPPPPLPPPTPQPNKSDAYSLSNESTSSDVEGDKQPSAARSGGGTDGDDDIDDDDDDDDVDDEDDDEEDIIIIVDAADSATEVVVVVVVVMAEVTTLVVSAPDSGPTGVVVSKPLRADIYFMARRSVVIFVNFSLCASTARCGTARRSASKASLISLMRLRSRAFAVFLRYLCIHTPREENHARYFRSTLARQNIGR